ncbi:CCA tRNA nucleotidyltransferase [Methanobrevibacter sp.]|uniref:CCA tRNA nucleotidyltransferase n=1 Tax=Methanobrevibacter sp. TaxID=66852 RepID=UPI0025D41397|nr:CCA tRNA nucleotidyltransferase [Methanobrevibacter sp.]MBQ2961999.1 CCA tRNA nucleotidyltransferase [Methanobrevibacter sp.]
MNYEFILGNIRPNQEEIDAVIETTRNVIEFINRTCEEEGIDAEANAVGSVAKGTWLSGKSDIDVFISFPYESEMDYLKEKGLDLAYKTNDEFKGKANEHYASHPYLTCDIDGFEIDIVPCYDLSGGKPIKSAVDRTILHTEYIQDNLKEEQIDEVLLLKRFMDAVGTYGSEFKTGGFAGYLCELLILKYGTFEDTLRAAQNWKRHTLIDLEDFGTVGNAIFKQDPLVFIDPTDENRNVGAALRLERYVDFIVASRNFLDVLDNDDLDDYERQEKILEFFNPLLKEHLDKSKEEIAKDILESFKDRETQTLVIKFPIPIMSADALHPQLLKTVSSICEKIDMEEFSVFKYDYWTDEEKFVIFTIELNVFKQGKYYIHKGPKVWTKKACDNFKAKWGDALYPLDEFMVLTRERQFKTAKDFIIHTLQEENIHIIKVGKNIKEAICSDDCILLEIDEFLNDLDDQFNYNISNKTSEELARDYLNSLDDFLNPGQYIKR